MLDTAFVRTAFRDVKEKFTIPAFWDPTCAVIVKHEIRCFPAYRDSARRKESV